MIIFDYKRAMEQVRELRAIASEMQRSRSLENAINGAGSSWQGQTANQFRNKCTSLADMIRKEANNIMSIADSLEQAARIIDEAERAAIAALSGGAANGGTAH